MLGVSIGKSKITPLEDATDDYLASFELVYTVADYVAINVSSPNTPQLRELQQCSATYFAAAVRCKLAIESCRKAYEESHQCRCW